MSKPSLPFTGGCQCGAVRYRITGWPLTLYCCHCSECQRQSASAFGMSMRVARVDVEIDLDAMAQWIRDEGKRTEAHGRFCPACGVRIMHDRPDSEAVTVKAGTLDDRSWLRPVGHIWTASAQSWVAIPGDTLNYERQPESYDDLVAAWRKQSRDG
jgi:hypothetical protein